MFGFHYITFVGVLILLPYLREADFLAVHSNGKREIDFHDSDVNSYLFDKSSSIIQFKEEVNHNEETMAIRQKRTTLTTTIDGKFTVQLIVRVKPAEQVVQPQMARGGRLRSGGRVQNNPINSRNCENENCDFEMELELLEQVSTPADSTGTQKEASKSQTSSHQGQVKTAPARTVSKLRSSRIQQATTTTTTRYPMITPSIKQVLNRTTIRYPTSISRPSTINQVVNRTGGRTTTRTPVNKNVTRISRIRTTSSGRSNPLSSRDSREDYLFMERRNENGPNKSRATQQQIRGKSPKAATRLFQSTRIQKKKEADPDVISTTEKNDELTQTTTDNQVQTENVSHPDNKQDDDLNLKFEAPIFRNSVERLNSFDGISAVTLTTPAGEDVTTQTTISNETVLIPVSLNDPIMSNITQLDEINISNMEPVAIQNDSFVTQFNGLLDIPLESSGNFTPTEQTLLNPTTETGIPLQTTTNENSITINSEEPECLPWEQIGDFEFQYNPKSRQVVNIRMQTTTTNAPAPYNPVTISYEEQEKSSLSEGGTPAATLEISATVIPTRTVTPIIKLPIPLNRRKPIAVTQSERVDSPLEPSRDFVLITTTPMGVAEPEQTVITESTRTSTTQNPELFRLSGEYKQVNTGMNETATNISVQQMTIPENSPTTEININSESVTSKVRIPIEEDIPTQSEPTAAIQLPMPINSRNLHVGESNVDDNISLVPVRKLTPTIVTSVASVVAIETTSTSPIPKLSDESEEFPWEPRDDYEVQVNPKTKQVVNIRMLTSTTHNTLSALPVEVSVVDATTAPDTAKVIDLTKANESVLTAEEQDELTVEVLGRILDRNGVTRTLVVPHRPKDNIGERILVKHSGEVGDDFPGVKVLGKTRVAVTAPPRTVPNGRDRSTYSRKPIFSHTSEDGVFYFRYANEDDELKHYTANANNRNKQIMDDERETDWDTRQRNDLPRQKESPYFYYSQDNNNSSALVKSSFHIVLLIACVSFLFL